MADRFQDTILALMEKKPPIRPFATREQLDQIRAKIIEQKPRDFLTYETGATRPDGSRQPVDLGFNRFPVFGKITQPGTHAFVTTVEEGEPIDLPHFFAQGALPEMGVNASVILRDFINTLKGKPSGGQLTQELAGTTKQLVKEAVEDYKAALSKYEELTKSLIRNSEKSSRAN